MSSQKIPVASVIAALAPTFSRMQRGFTLIELMVVMSIAAVLAVIAIPSFTDTMSNFRQRSALGLLVSDLNQARGEAIKRGARVLVCARNAAGTGCETTAPNWRSGWVVCVDATTTGTTPELAPSDGVCDASSSTNRNLIVTRPALNAVLTLTVLDATAAAISSIHFNANSSQGAGAAVTLALGGTWSGATTRTITIAGTGNISK